MLAHREDKLACFPTDWENYSVPDSAEILFPEFEPGWVWLVGAGPGDPGLITLHALHGLRHADMVVHDALVDKRILAFANPKAQIIHAGKRGGKPSPKQIDISLRLVELAKNGHRVLRLKGGDPFVFGRGAEEGLTLVANNVPFRVIPGITAGIAGPAYAGIPVTHRDANSAVTFVTGHGAGGDVPDRIKWSALAESGAVLVFYMVIKHLARITEKLMEGGCSPDTPAALVNRATTPSQRVLRATLATIAGEGRKSGIEPPALLIVGDVVALRDDLRWWNPSDVIDYVI